MASAGGDTPSSGNAASISHNATPSRPRGDGNRGRGRGRGGRGRGRGGEGQTRGDGGGGRGGGAHRGRGRANSGTQPAESAAPPETANEAGNSITTRPGAKSLPLGLPDATTKAENTGEGEGEPDSDADVCFICANPVIHHSIAPCNHLTCHICALRMRALYKTKDCPHCRTAAPFVIFTDDPTRRFDEYTDADITSTDDNIGIRYTSEDIVGDTILLLRYNCPDPSCDFAALGWPDLHRHVKSVHHKRMCDLCTRNKKVFTHEHELFADKALEKHMRQGDDRPGAIDQTGFKGHPMCDFCGERFYDDDKLYEHCRNKHERCFICDRRDSRHPHYYRNYDELEKHFRKDHFLCLDRECQEKKFVVFESELDLQAHQLSEHGNTLSKDVRRDARVVNMSGFDFRPSYQQERRGGGGRGHGEGRARGRDPNAEPLPVSSAQPMRRDEIAFQRQMAIHSAQSVSGRTFGGQLTTPAPSTTSTPSPAPARQNGAVPAAAAAGVQSQPLADSMESMTITDPANLTPQERAQLVRHRAVIERASNLLGNDATKMRNFRSHISSFRTGSLTAPQLIDSFFALFADTSSTALGTLVREVAELFEDKAKADALRKAWHDWRAINEDYPSLPGLGGMHGETTSTSGWASAASASSGTLAGPAAQRHTTRVLKLKNSTRRGSASSAGSSASGAPAPAPAPVTRSVPGATWTAPSRSSATTSTSSSAFPALPGAGTGARVPQQPSWISAPGRPAAAPAPRPVAAPSTVSAPRRPAAANSEEAFPALPTAPKPLTTIFGYGSGAVRRDLGGSRDTGFSWGGSSSAGADSSGDAAGGDGGEDAEGAGKGKKKGKQGKKVLVQWG